MRENDDGKTVAACDLLVPAVGELVGGSQREERLAVLEKKMSDLGIKEGLEWYLDTRRYGGCKHAGFGIGFGEGFTSLYGLHGKIKVRTQNWSAKMDIEKIYNSEYDQNSN